MWPFGLTADGSRKADDDVIVQIPLETRGNLFLSVMPYGKYDPQGAVLAEYHRKYVKHVVMLNSDEECMEKAGRNLRSLYLQKGLGVTYFPVPDMTAPPVEECRKYAPRVLEQLHNGITVAVHCSSGIGRSGTFVVCLAKLLWQVDGTEAIRRIRASAAVLKTEGQERVVQSF
jgi:protein-tyrosine phosphatase